MGEPDSKIRNAEVTEMLDYAFAQYELEEMLSTSRVVGKAEVLLGNKTEVEIVPLESITFLNKKGTPKKNATYELIVEKLKAPIKAGTQVGELIVKEDANVIRKVPVTIKEDIKRLNILELYIRNLGKILN